jgi:hypothetical protein
VDPVMWGQRHKGKKERRMVPALLKTILQENIDYYGVSKLRIISLRETGRKCILKTWGEWQFYHLR